MAQAGTKDELPLPRMGAKDSETELHKDTFAVHKEKHFSTHPSQDCSNILSLGHHS